MKEKLVLRRQRAALKKQRESQRRAVFTTSGEQSGSCPHQHDTRKEAADCIKKSGHNDRHIYVGDPRDSKDSHWVGARKVPDPTFMDTVRVELERFRFAFNRVRYQAELRIALEYIEQWQHAVSPSIHKPARALFKALKAAGFGK